MGVGSPFCLKKKWRKKKSIKEDDLNSKTNNANLLCILQFWKRLCTSWKANSYSWNTIVCLLVHCWLGNLRIQSFQGQKKSCKLQWASSGAMLFTRYPIMHTCVCVRACTCWQRSTFVTPIHVFWFIHCVNIKYKCKNTWQSCHDNFCYFHLF